MKSSTLVVASLSAISLASIAQARVLLSFDGIRGGNGSVTDSPTYATLRSDIATQFPDYSVLETSTLSPASLAGVDVAWLGVARVNGLAVTLSAGEQTALMDFVVAGGTAVLFCDNDTFAPAAPAGNASFVGQFGISIAGTMMGDTTHTVVNASNFIMNGVYGSVGATLTTSYPGYFTTVPSNAQVLARIASNNEASVLWIPAGALAPTSGDVIFFSDSGFRGTGGAISSNFDRLYRNILAQVPSPSGLLVFGAGALAMGRRRR